MLKIGNKSLGFTLIEVMLAAAVLSLGAVLIHEVFFTCLDAFNYCNNYFNVAYWLDEKLWQAQDELARLGPLAQMDSSGEFRIRNKDFSWDLSYGPACDTPDLYEIGVFVSWKEGPRNIKISRMALAKYVEKK